MKTLDMRMAGPKLGPRQLFELNRKPNQCHVADCETPTRHGKPYCFDHISHMPYAREVQEAVEACDREAEKAFKTAYGWRTIDVNGHRATEIIESIKKTGARNIERLAIDLNFPVPYLRVYISALTHVHLLQKILKKTQNGKWNEIIDLGDPEKRARWLARAKQRAHELKYWKQKRNKDPQKKARYQQQKRETRERAKAKMTPDKIAYKRFADRGHKKIYDLRKSPTPAKETTTNDTPDVR